MNLLKRERCKQVSTVRQGSEISQVQPWVSLVRSARALQKPPETHTHSGEVFKDGVELVRQSIGSWMLEDSLPFRRERGEQSAVWTTGIWRA